MENIEEMTDFSETDKLAGKYILSDKHYSASEVIAALLPCSQINHPLQGWIWRRIANAANELDDVDTFLKYSELFVFSSITQGADYRIGKIETIINRVERLVSLNRVFQSEISEVLALSPSENDLQRLQALGVNHIITDLPSFDDDYCITFEAQRVSGKCSQIAIGAPHFAVIAVDSVRPIVRVVKNVEYFSLGSDTSILRPGGTFYRHMSRSRTVIEAYTQLANSGVPDVVNGRVIILDDMFHASNYCHWMADWFPRALIARECGVQFDFVCTRHANQRFERESLVEVLGISENKIIVDNGNSWLKFDQAITVDNNSISTTHPMWHGNQDILELVRKNFFNAYGCSNRKDKKFYVQRKNSRGRSVVNEDELILMLAEFDVVPVDLNDAPLSSQIEMFSSCNFLIGVHGAGLTNLMFMPPSGVVVELFHYRYGSSAYPILANAAEQNYYYLSCATEPYSTLPFDSAANANSLSFIEHDVWVDIDRLRLVLVSALK